MKMWFSGEEIKQAEVAENHGSHFNYLCVVKGHSFSPPERLNTFVFSDCNVQAVACHPLHPQSEGVLFVDQDLEALQRGKRGQNKA